MHYSPEQDFFIGWAAFWEWIRNDYDFFSQSIPFTIYFFSLPSNSEWLLPILALFFPFSCLPVIPARIWLLENSYRLEQEDFFPFPSRIHSVEWRSWLCTNDDRRRRSLRFWLIVPNLGRQGEMGQSQNQWAVLIFPFKKKFHFDAPFEEDPFPVFCGAWKISNLMLSWPKKHKEQG